MKAVNREYYYVDYRRAIDATKYRIHMLDERIKANAKPTQEKKEFYCPQCKAQWTTMEVLDHVDFLGRESGFLCRTCDHPLKSIHLTNESQSESDDIPAKFNRQFAALLKLMQDIDQVTIPAIEGEAAVESARELPRDNDINPAAKHEPVMPANIRPTAVKGIATGPEKIEISIATEEEYTEAQRAAEAARSAQISRQNALPEWHAKSTVDDKEYFAKTGQPSSTPAVNGTSTPSVKTEAADGGQKGEDPALDAYFEALKAEQERQAKEAEEEEEEEDDDEDEFEDVVTTGMNGTPDPKRIKISPPVVSPPQVKFEASSPIVAPSPAAGGGTESDEDEFEDAM
jgi:transcription initiation factor TFIIE subunit alpha